MKPTFLLALDQSTSGTKALLIDQQGKIIHKQSREHKQYYPQIGWVEQDPMEIYNNVKSLLKEVMANTGTTSTDIAFISITNQRETALIWDAKTGEPIHRSIVWQCRRTTSICEEMKIAGHEPGITAKTGLLLDPYFSATKWQWLLKHCQSQVPHKNLMAGTIDSWLIWKLTGGAVHASDYTNASRTLLFNIHTLEWDPELIHLFGLEDLALPEIKPSDAFFGYLTDETIIGNGSHIPIYGVMGDSQAALFAQRCTEPGMAKATYGTGSSVLMNVGAKPIAATDGLVLALAWKLQTQTQFALEGIIHTSGDCLKWAKENMNLFDSYEELESLASSVLDSDGVYVVPAFVGLGAPYWKPNAKAAFIGMNRSTTRAHVLRACIDSIAYQICDVVDLMTKETAIQLHELRADGGASKNKQLMQIQSDYLGKSVITTKTAELSALGAAYAGGLGIEFWTVEDLDRIYQIEEQYTPLLSDIQRSNNYQGWKKAISSVIK